MKILQRILIGWLALATLLPLPARAQTTVPTEATAAQVTAGTSGTTFISPRRLTGNFTGTANITTLGNVTTGTWSATAIGATRGGTGLTSYTVGDLLYADSTTSLAKLGIGTSGYVLKSQGAGLAPAWVSTGSLGVLSAATANETLTGTNSTSYVTPASMANITMGLNTRAPRGGVYFDGTSSSRIYSTLTGQGITTDPFSLTIHFQVPSSNPSGSAFGLIWLSPGFSSPTMGRSVRGYLDTSGHAYFELYGATTSDFNRARIDNMVSRFGGRAIVLTFVRNASGDPAVYINGVAEALTLTSGGSVPTWQGSVTSDYFGVGYVDASAIARTTIHSASFYNYALPQSRVTWIAENGGAVHPEDQSGSQALLNDTTFALSGGGALSGASSTAFTLTAASGVNYVGHRAVLGSTSAGLRPIGAKYRAKFTATLNSGATPTIAMAQTNDGTQISNAPSVTAGSNAVELTTTTAGSWVVAATFTTSGATDYAVSGFSLQRLGAVVHLPFSTGSGTIAYDQSSNQLNASLTSTGVAWANPHRSYTLGNVTNYTAFTDDGTTSAITVSGTNRGITITANGTGTIHANATANATNTTSGALRVGSNIGLSGTANGTSYFSGALDINTNSQSAFRNSATTDAVNINPASATYTLQVYKNSADAVFRMTRAGVRDWDVAAGSDLLIKADGTTRLTISNSGNLTLTGNPTFNGGTATTASASGTANAKLVISVPSATTGDPFVDFVANGVQEWTAGVDSSDSGAFKIDNGSSPGSNTKLRISAAGDVTIGGALIESVDTLSGAGAVSVTASATKLTTTGANALTLANGTNGQVKRITLISDGGDGTLTPTTKTGFSTITFNDVGDSVTLQYYTTQGWMILSNYGCTVAP